MKINATLIYKRTIYSKNIFGLNNKGKFTLKVENKIEFK
jgi:hypothetical protein